MWWIFICVYCIAMFLIFQYLQHTSHASLCLCTVCSREHQAVATHFNLPTPTRAALLTKIPSAAGLSCWWEKAAPSISNPPWGVHSNIEELCVTLHKFFSYACAGKGRVTDEPCPAPARYAQLPKLTGQLKPGAIQSSGKEESSAYQPQDLLTRDMNRLYQ